MKISIVIPTYNSKKLDRLLDSLQEQLHKKNLEIIIVDDCSTDKEFLNILKNYKDLDIHLIENEVNMRQSLSRQVGFKAATGDWISFYDHDDMCVPGSLLQIYNDLQNCEFALFSNILVTDKQDNWWEDIINPEGAARSNFKVTTARHWLHGNFFNRAKLLKYGLNFHNQLLAHEDTYFMSIIQGICDFEKNKKEDAKEESLNFIKMSKSLSYIWFIDPDSLSHEMYLDEETGRLQTYVEKHYEDYLKAGFDSWKFLNTLYQDYEIMLGRLMSLIIAMYWQYQSILFDNKVSTIRNLESDKGKSAENVNDLNSQYFSYIQFLLSFDKKNCIEFLYSNGKTTFCSTFLHIIQDNGIELIPVQTFEEWVSNMYDNLKELTEEELKHLNFHKNLCFKSGIEKGFLIAETKPNSEK